MSILKRIASFIINTFFVIVLAITTLMMMIGVFLMGLIARLYFWIFKPQFVPTEIKMEQKYYPYTHEDVIIFNH